MKRMKWLVALVAVSVLMLVLTACGNDRVEPEKAAKQTIEAMMFGKNTDNIEKIYGKSEDNFDTKFEDSFVKGFEQQAGASGADADKAVREFYKAFQKRNSEVGSVTAKQTNDDKDKPVVQVKAKGIDMQSVSTELQSEVTAAAKKDSSIATDRVKIIKLYTKVIKKAKAVSEPSTIEMKFEVNKDNKKWKIANQSDFIQQVGTAFVGGTN